MHNHNAHMHKYYYNNINITSNYENAKIKKIKNLMK